MVISPSACDKVRETSLRLILTALHCASHRQVHDALQRANGHAVSVCALLPPHSSVLLGALSALPSEASTTKLTGAHISDSALGGKHCDAFRAEFFCARFSILSPLSSRGCPTNYLSRRRDLPGCNPVTVTSISRGCTTRSLFPIPLDALCPKPPLTDMPAVNDSSLVLPLQALDDTHSDLFFNAVDGLECADPVAKPRFVPDSRELGVHDDETTPLLPVRTGDQLIRRPKSVKGTHQSQFLIAVCFALLGSTSFTGMNMFVRYGTTALGFSPIHHHAARGLFSCIAVPIVLWGYDIPRPTRDDIGLIILRGVVGSSAMLIGYSSLAFLPLSEARAIMFTDILFAVIIGSVVLHEGFSPFDMLSALFCFAGVYMIAVTEFSGHAVTNSSQATKPATVGIALALSSAVFTGTAYVVTRLRSKNVHPLWNTLSLGVSALVMSLVYMGSTTTEFVRLAGTSPAHTAVLIATGLCAFLGATSLNTALMTIPAGFLAVLRTIDMPLSFVFGALFLGERTFSQSVFIGCGLIGLGSLSMGVRRAMSES